MCFQITNLIPSSIIPRLPDFTDVVCLPPFFILSTVYPLYSSNLGLLPLLSIHSTVYPPPSHRLNGLIPLQITDARPPRRQLQLH